MKHKPTTKITSSLPPKNTGTQANPLRVTKALTEQFWEHVDEEHKKSLVNCWISVKSKTSCGYSQIKLDYWREIKNNKNIARYRKTGAHRYSFLLHNPQYKTIPTGCVILHICPGKEERACLNPNHLMLSEPGALGSRQNMQHMKMRGNHHIGSKHGRAKLTERDVYDIREDYAEGGVSQKKLSIKWGVHQACIGFIVNGRTWTHVGGRRTRKNKKRKASSTLRKFTDDQVREIRKRFEAGEPSGPLGIAYNCSHQTVIAMCNRSNYKNVT